MNPVTVEFYLVVGQRFNPSGWRDGKPSVRVCKGKPVLGKDEVPIKLKLDLPEALFKRPQLSASIVVPPDNAPADISAEVQDNIAAAIRDATGMDVRITLAAPDPDNGGAA